MTRPLLTVALALLCITASAQSTCSHSSTLFQFDSNKKPRDFTEKLGNHPQFPFLQQKNGITTRSAFIRSVKDPATRNKYNVSFPAFNQLLKDIGFANGWKDLRASNIENTFVNPGTIGNLGFFNKGSNYTYVSLMPAGEGEDGIAAWQITGPTGCTFYILHTCGNAFFAKDPLSAGGVAGCCRDIKFTAEADTLVNKQSHLRRIHITIRFYQAMVASKKKHQDTLVQLVRTIDTISTANDSMGYFSKISGEPTVDQFVLCKDTAILLHVPLKVDTTGGGAITYILNDTSWVRSLSKDKDECHKKWEIAVDGGGSFNSIPRYDNTTEHTRTNGAQLAGELAISRIFNHWFQAGISASYITLSYQDDIPYAGSAPNTYNTVYPGKPIIPVQLFGKATIGGPLGWQSNITLSAGAAIPGGSKIVNSGNTLTTSPSTKVGVTAGVKMGVAYFFSCKFGLALSVGGQYFNNKASTQTYHLIAMPVTLGLRFRW